MMDSTATTWLTSLTPPGRGAIATLAICGPNAWRAVCELFEPHKRKQPLPEKPNRGDMWYGRIGKSDAGGADDVILAVKNTDLMIVEIHCHGGVAVVEYLSELCSAYDIKRCDWRTFLRVDNKPQQALIREQIARAPTKRTALILLDQLHGAFEASINNIIRHLDSREFEEATELLNQLAEKIEVGRHLTKPWKVVIAGAPNVGKSSLVNALAGFARSVVSSIPGTTRDVVSTNLAIDGWPVEVFDTAGWRKTTEVLEQKGMERAETAFQQADLCYWVLDGSTDAIWPKENADRFTPVVNKIDIPPAWNTDQIALRVSAKTREGMEELCEIIATTLVPRPPTTGTAVPYTDEICDQLLVAAKMVGSSDNPGALDVLRTLLNPHAK